MLDKKIVKELNKILDPENVLTSKEALVLYSRDASRHHHLPDAVVMPTTTQGVSRVLRLANERGIPVTPRGAGTNLSGGAVPVSGGIVMVLTKLNKIMDIDEESLIARVQPGVVNSDLQKALEPRGLFFPPDPASLSVSTIGGNVAEGAGGPRGMKYGVTKDYVLGLEVVLPTGEIIRTGGRTVKNVTGYDLTRLFIGSEGTLGVITEITLRILPLPEAKKTLLAVYDDLGKAAETVSQIHHQGILPVTLEIMDQGSIRCVEEYAKIGLPVDAEAILLIEVDGSRETVEREALQVENFCRAQGAREVNVAKDAKEADRLWEARRSCFAAMARRRPTIIVEDATVPRGKLAQMMNKVKQIAEKHKVEICTIAHAGDGNLHPQIMTDESDPEEMERVEAAIGEIFRETIALGGTLSGEHGIGLEKKKFLKLEIDPGAIEVMKKIKKALDPKNILNPDKIWE